MNKKVKISAKRALELYEDEGLTVAEISSLYDCSPRTIDRRLANARAKKFLDAHDKEDIDKISFKLAKQKQKYQDMNRIERKAFRDFARKENALLEYNQKLIQVLEKHKLPKRMYKTRPKINKKINATGVVHLTDAHLNELVDLPINKYDFKIASKRLKHYTNKINIHAKAENLKHLVVALTGDMLNSDRRMDELLSEATNRSQATFIAVSLLEQFLVDLSDDFNLTIASVIGNESRVGKEVGWTENLASDNYDYTIYNILKLIFRDTKVKFLEGGSVEKVIEVSGQNVLLLHGNQIKSTSMEKSIQKIKGKYNSRNVNIAFVLSGHLHSCRISDGFARGGSLVGPNAFSDSGLQLESRASQNFHIFYDNGTRDSMKIDLQNVKNVKGYPIDKTIKAYNAKSTDKAQKKVIVQKIV